MDGAPPVSGEQENSAIATPQAASATGCSEALHQDTGEVGLQFFNYSTLDPTLPSPWEALGNALITNGRQPLQEESMMLVMEFTVSMANQALPSAPATAPANESVDGSEVDGGFPWRPSAGWSGQGRTQTVPTRRKETAARRAPKSGVRGREWKHNHENRTQAHVTFLRP